MFRLILVFTWLLLGMLPAIADPRNDAERIPALYWGIRSQQAIPKASGLVSLQEEFLDYTFRKAEIAIPYPLKAHYAQSEAERYWVVGNRVFRYDQQTKTTRLVVAHYHEQGEWKLWRLRDLALSPTGKYISFTEEYTDVTNESMPRFRHGLAVMDLSSKRVTRFSNAVSRASWSPSRDRLAYKPACESNNDWASCKGLLLVNADGSKAIRVMNNAEIERFEWLDGDTLLYGEKGPFNDSARRSEPLVLKRFHSDGSTTLVYDFLEHHKGLPNLYSLDFTALRDRFLFWVDEPLPDSEVGMHRRVSLNMGNLKGQPIAVPFFFQFDGPAGTYAELSPDGTKAVAQLCPDHSFYCEDTWILNLQTGHRVAFPGNYRADWLDNDRLLLIQGREDVRTNAERVDSAHLLVLGQVERPTYYRLNVGAGQGLMRGDILQAYSQPKYNAVTGEEDGVDPASLKGNLIVVKVAHQQSWALKYTPNEVELKPGFRVTNGQTRGRVAAVEQLAETF